MLSTKQLLIGTLILGCCLVVTACIGLTILPGLRSYRRLFGSEALTVAWIGFSGSFLAALFTISVAVVALWPTYQQLQETRKASAVSNGEALRKRLAAAQDEMGILFLDAPLHSNAAALQLDPQDVDRNTWLQRHPEKAQTIRSVLLPTLGSIATKLFQGIAGPDLPEVDRQSYFEATAEWQKMLYTVLDGEPREANGIRGSILDAVAWRAHVQRTQDYISDELAQAKLKLNNSLNLAQQALKFEIMKWDRVALGTDTVNTLNRVQEVGRQLGP